MKRNKMVPLRQLSSTARTKRTINLVAESLLMLSVVAMTIYYMVIGDPNKRLLSCIGTFVAFGALWVIELLWGRRFTFAQHIMVEFYMFFTMFLGSVLLLHKTFAPFDEISHFLFGYFSCIVIFYGFEYSKAIGDNRGISKAIVILFISMGTAAVWEIMEFGVDFFFGESSMGLPPQAILEKISRDSMHGIQAHLQSLRHTSVIDTATDMALHFAGAVVFVVQYLIYALGKKNVLLGNMINEVRKDEMNTAINNAGKDEMNTAINNAGNDEMNTAINNAGNDEMNIAINNAGNDADSGEHKHS